MKVSPFAGKLPEPADLINVQSLIRAYELNHPDPKIPAQRVLFGTSGHRGSATESSFVRDHILAITQAICVERKRRHITGPLFIGFDTHALSVPAFQTAMEVLSANEITVLTALDYEFTPTPVISHAIICYNRGRTENLADGIVITPSHNPPAEGGFKYNPPHGGPAEKSVTDSIQNQANQFLVDGLKGIRQVDFELAMKLPSTQAYDFRTPYVEDLIHVVDMKAIRESHLRLGVDPLGGAGVHYWPHIADFYKINLSVLNTQVDPQFAFMTRDWDGQIRMDPSSPYVMKSLIEKAKNFDIAFACDTDHDRHGIVTRKVTRHPGSRNGNAPSESELNKKVSTNEAQLMPSNHYLAVAVDYLFSHRPLWPKDLKVGKTLVSSQMIDRAANGRDRSIYEVPVGFKWFVDGLSRAGADQGNALGFAGEESVGATFLRRNGATWTTDKDGITAALLSAEMMAVTGQDPAKLYAGLEEKWGSSFYQRVEVAANSGVRQKLANARLDDLRLNSLAGEKINKILYKAPSDGVPIGGFKIEAESGWIAARPSGTEDIYKIYAESFKSVEHLETLITEGQTVVRQATK